MRVASIRRLALSRARIATILAVYRPAVEVTIGDVGSWCPGASDEVAFVEVEHSDARISAIECLRKLTQGTLLPLVSPPPPATPSASSASRSPSATWASATSVAPGGGKRDLTASLRAAVPVAAAAATPLVPQLICPIDHGQHVRLYQVRTRGREEGDGRAVACIV
jgi:hypothetical protein